MSKLLLNSLLAVAYFGILCAYVDAAPHIGICGSIENAYGPYDYTNPDHFKNKLPIVERSHFSPETEQLKGIVNQRLGEAIGDRHVAGSIDYTLRAFPNHHRALYAMARYHVQGRQRAMPMRYSAECYFDRAIRFRPDDPSVRVIFGYYNAKTGQIEIAIEQYHKALSLGPESAEAHYNLGLIYLEQEQYDAAVKHARRSYELGFPLPWLNDKLIRLGLIKSNTQLEQSSQLKRQGSDESQ